MKAPVAALQSNLLYCCVLLLFFPCELVSVKKDSKEDNKHINLSIAHACLHKKKCIHSTIYYSDQQQEAMAYTCQCR